MDRSGDMDARQKLLAGLPVTERRLDLAGIATAVLEGGDGPPVVLLHGPGAHAAQWMTVIPGLVASHRVVVPDLPGHGASSAGEGRLDAGRVLSWLGELIARTCASPPALVGLVLGGAIAARFAAAHGDRLSRLVLMDAMGLAPFRPPPDFGLALTRFLERPDERSHEELWTRCVHDLGRLRRRLGDRWEQLVAYNLDRMNTPSVKAGFSALFEEFGMPEIPAEELERIAVPTTLIWAGHDPVAPLSIAHAASARYGWPLQVIEEAGNELPFEQPEAVLRALRVALGTTIVAEARA